MDEIEPILKKYEKNYLSRLLSATSEADELARIFFNDVSDILDFLCRLKNVERNPNGYSIDDAPILGLLVRISKLLKLLLWIYSEESVEYGIIAERSLLETAVTAIYLLNVNESTMEDYRRCSYRNRMKILKQAASGMAYYRSKAGQRLLTSIKKKLAAEGLNENSFDEQIANDWRLEGKTFLEIFESVIGKDLYQVIYGISSDSVHGSWLDTRHYSLYGDVTHGFYPLYEPVRENVGNLSVIVSIAVMPFSGWLKRVHLDDQYISKILDFIELLNSELCEKYGNSILNE